MMIVKCKQCNITFDKRPSQIKKTVNHFCSRSCSATFNNLKKTKYIDCENCKQITKIDRPKRRFCSQKCSAEAMWKRQVKEINEAQNGNPRKCKAGNPVGAKKYLIEVRGHACEICKLGLWMGQPIPLIMDHISGNSDDNSLKNLRLVCGNCDMQLPTYKSKNNGNGRASRRKKKRSPRRN